MPFRNVVTSNQFRQREIENSEDTEIMKFSRAAPRLITVSFGAAKLAAHPKDTVLVLSNHQHTLKIESLAATKPAAHPEDTVLVLPNHQHNLKIVLVLPNHQQTLKIVLVLPNHQHTLKIDSLGATKPAAHPEDTFLVLRKQRHTLKIQSLCYQTTSTP